GTVDLQITVVDDVAADGTGRAAIADIHEPVLDRRTAGMREIARHGQRTASALRQRTAAGHVTAIGVHVGTIEYERTVVDDVARDRPGRAAVADLQRAVLDRRAAGMREIARYGQRPRTTLGERTAAGDHVRIGDVVRTVED